MTEQENRNFYRYQTGYASHGGYNFLCGFPRLVPKSCAYDEDGAKAFLFGYDQASKLWPTPESREWFSP